MLIISYASTRPVKFVNPSLQWKREYGLEIITLSKIAILTMVLTLIGCSDIAYFPSNSSQKIWLQLKANKFESINFSEFGSDKWTRVCFLGPYNENSTEALGFDWQVSDYTDVLKSDGHNVIVFATDTEVIEYVIHSRGKGDFSGISGECLSRGNSVLRRDTKSSNWLN